MTAIKSQHSRVFEQMVADYRLSLIEALVAGTPADHAAYRQIVGQIQGLSDGLKISERADFEISGEEPDAGN